MENYLIIYKGKKSQLNDLVYNESRVRCIYLYTHTPYNINPHPKIKNSIGI